MKHTPFRRPCRLQLESLETRDVMSTVGYDPAQWLHAEGIDQIHATGRGIGIADVVVGDQTNAQADLDIFDARYALPPTQVTIIRVGSGIPSGVGTGWDEETDLDLQTMHAAAPGAHLYLYEVPTGFLFDIFAGVQAATHDPRVNVVGLSFGSNADIPGDFTDSNLIGKRVTVFASSGDSGAGVSYPASSPYVIGVGGTSLQISGRVYEGETAWPGSGGGISAFESSPPAQRRFLHGQKARHVPDIAADADPATGYHCYLSTLGWRSVGGTSAGPPLECGVWARVDELRHEHGQAPLDAAQSQRGIYEAPAKDFHDITQGASDNGHTQEKAGPGYDLVTGRGSLDGGRMGAYLASYRPHAETQPLPPPVPFTAHERALLEHVQVHAGPIAVKAAV